MIELRPDRVTKPLRRREDGSSKSVSWEVALHNIGCGTTIFTIMADRPIADGDTIAVSSAHGRIALPVSLTEGIVRGTVAIPARIGPQGKCWLAIGQSGRRGERNQLMSSDPSELETLAGMSWLTGVPVRVETAQR